MSAAPTPVAGPHRPVTDTPELAAGQARRTTSIDLVRPEGLDGPIDAHIRGRDLVRPDDGPPETTDHLELRVRIDAMSGRVEVIDDPSSDGQVRRLVGADVRRGFGRAVIDALPDDAAHRTLLYSALEDLNGANLVSGYAPLRAGLYVGTKAEGEARAAMQADVCAGWVRGGPMLEGLRLTGNNAVPMGPTAPSLAGSTPTAGGTATVGAWHQLAPLATHTVRRVRRLDVQPPSSHHRRGGLGAHFRDSYQATDHEMVLHEYLVSADLIVGGTDPQLTIDGIEVDVRVLPWDSCPDAAPSAARLDGTLVSDLPARVRAELVGPSTCTHLNSTVRSLADADALVAALQRVDRA